MQNWAEEISIAESCSVGTVSQVKEPGWHVFRRIKRAWFKSLVDRQGRVT